VPADLARALKQDPAASQAFEGLSYTHRKEYARWVEDAKKPETRQRRWRRRSSCSGPARSTPERPLRSLWA
jgi:uncharacterized protein YdeI (YjbR/CyaY-like superfamily)